MAIVAGIDFGTLSVRVSLFDQEKGRLGAASSGYSLHRSAKDPDLATQSHSDQMEALVVAMREALASASIQGAQVDALAVDATGSSVIMVGEDLEPLSDYYLWCDHRSWREAAEITDRAHEANLEAINWCGGTYSSEWGFSKVLHWLRHNPNLRSKFVTALENCDMVTATLCGIRNADQLSRSVCAAGHKWMYGERWDGLPSQAFLSSVDPLFDGIRAKLGGSFQTSDKIAGHLSPEWADRLGLRAGIPIPVGALDAHWDALAANLQLGDVANVIGTSTCIIGVSEMQTLVPGVCGVVPGSVLPNMTGIEAGLSGVGDIFDSIAHRAGSSVAALMKKLSGHSAGQTGLLRLTWDNGDRTILTDPALSGVTFGWRLTHTAEDELFAAIEGTAFHTRIILERMEQYGTQINRVINGGGIPQRNDQLNHIYADVIGKPVLVPDGDVTSLGSAIFAFLACGAFQSVTEAQQALCPPFRVFMPQSQNVAIYEKLYELYKNAYFGLGSSSESIPMNGLLHALRKITDEIRLKDASPLPALPSAEE